MVKNEKLRKPALALLAMQRHSWEQGTAMHAFYEMGEEDIVIAMAFEAANRSIADGRASVMGGDDAVTDPCSVGEWLKFAYDRTKDERLGDCYRNLLRWALEEAPRNKDGIVYHMKSSCQFWVDSTYMLPPFLAAAGYYEEALKQFHGYWSALYQSSAGLMSHMWDDQTKSFIRPDFWGVGNGWTLAALARLIDLLPRQMEAARRDLIHKAVHLLEAAVAYVQEDGSTFDILNDPASFREVNFPQMYAYTIYRGVCSGWLAPKWLPQADRCRRMAENQVDGFGLVQNVCGAPHFNKPGVAPEGQAFYLLMEVEAQRMSHCR